MTAQNSPYYRIGMIHGAYDTARPAGMRRYYHPEYAASWMYRRGFARAARLARGLAPIAQPRQQTPQQRAEHRTDGRVCWCWARHTPNSFEVGQQQLAAKLADPNRTDWTETP